ncbi:MAG TPA: hypothetical protein PL059_07070 [Spirochaetota bacterium]|nr:hypothetical protein [Spirochaetota bacterium]HOM10753.1 hypothetical protein [Spirochaetota bacterium]HPP50617.1 hypothetical protein [Spirochaetota bacterium]
MDGKVKRSIIINRYYQLKTGFGVAGLFALCISILFIITGSFVMWNNRSISRAMAHQLDLQNVQDDILKSIEMLSQYGNRKNLIFEAYKAIGDLQKNASALKESNELLTRSIAINRYLMWINGVLGITLVVVTFIIVVRRTHRVAGPMFLLKRYMNEIIEGKVPEIRPLRKGDEFKDVFDTFTKMVESLHLKHRKNFKQKK